MKNDIHFPVIKRFLLTAMFLIFAGIVKASWEPFPLGQKSFFSHMNQSEYTTVAADTIVTVNGKSFILFNQNSTDQIPSACTNYAVSYLIDHSIDSLEIAADTLKFKMVNYNFSNIFLPNIPVGSYFDNPSNGSTIIRITRLADSLMTFLNITDSIRIFEMQAMANGSPVINQLNGERIILSKNYGFIRYYPLNEFMLYTTSFYDLIGIENVTTGGFVQPTCSSYFPYQPGDILIWHTPSVPYPYLLPSYDTRDSIIAILNTVDSIGYTVYTKIFAQPYNAASYWTTYQYNRWFSREYLCNLANAPTEWATAFSGFGAYTTFYFASNFFPQNDGSVTREIIDNGYTSDSLCNISEALDYGYSESWNSFQGLIKKCEMVWTQSCTTLVASCLSGIVRGDTTFTVNIQTPQEVVSSIYPNPATERIHITANVESQAYLLNSIGDVVLSAKLIKGKNDLNISFLPAGFYFLKVNTANGTTINRIIKL